jgi:hypothetical protein
LEHCEFDFVAGLNGRKEAQCPDLNPRRSRIEGELANQRAVLVGTSDQDPTSLTPLSSARSSRARSGRCAVLNQPEAGKPTKSQKESCMKLNPAQVERALTQFEAQALPDDHPVVPQLASMFGDHTFFIDSGGLNVLEPAEASEQEAPAGMIVNLAYWSDETLTKLSPHEPEPTGVIVSLESRH